MKNTMKRFFMWMLMLAMLCSLLPANALATTVDDEPEFTIIEDETVTMINPLYADLITLEDLDLPDPDSGISLMAEVEYATTYAAAAAQLREGLKARAPVIQVYYRTTNHNFEKDSTAIRDAAFAHTGEPTEGDYLRWVWGGGSRRAERYEQSGVAYVTYTFTYDYYTTAEQEEELDEAVEALLAELNPTGTDYQKLKTVYDYICANITYDYDSEGMLKHTAYAALVDKTAVCQGYATLLYRLALEMGIDNRLISGIGNGGGHGWNIVELDDLYYNVDSTWDATWMQELGYYNYFLQCEETFTEGGTDHFRDAEYDTAAFHAAYPMSQTDYVPVEEEESYEVTFATASVSLAGDIGVNYYVQLSDNIVADKDAYMEFTVAGQTQTMPLSEAIVSTDSKGVTNYRFSCKVAAKQMTENITAQMYLSDGTPVGNAKNYSVKAYCDKAIPTYSMYEGYASLVTLLEAMLNYGAYSQVHFGYNTDNLANVGVNAVLPALTAAEMDAYAHSITGSGNGISVASASLLLESTTTIRFYFNLDGTTPIDEYAFMVDGKQVTPVQFGANQYYVDKVNVAAKDLDEMVTVTVDGLTVNYSGLSYVRQVAVRYPDTYGQNMVNVTKALYAYNQAANAYFQ